MTRLFRRGARVYCCGFSEDGARSLKEAAMRRSMRPSTRVSTNRTLDVLVAEDRGSVDIDIQRISSRCHSLLLTESEFLSLLRWRPLVEEDAELFSLLKHTAEEAFRETITVAKWQESEERGEGENEEEECVPEVDYVWIPYKESYSFCAIDAEMADSSGRICALSAARVENGKIVQHVKTLINPECRITPFTVKIHGITNEQVRYSPTFDKVWHSQIVPLLTSADFLCAFEAASDADALAGCCEKYAIMPDDVPVMCTRRMANGYGVKGSLVKTADALGISMKGEHHDPLADALACAEITSALVRMGAIPDDFCIGDILYPL